MRLWPLLGLVLLVGCATDLGAVGGRPEEDAFARVLAASGVVPDALPGEVLSLEQARGLLGEVARARVTPRSFGPRRVLAWLLGEVLASGVPVEAGELRRRVRRFERLVLVRPDGTLVAALTGEPLHRLGRLALVEGEWRVGRLVVGDFYCSRGGVLYPVNAVLGRVDTPPWGEVGLGRDWLNAALDGTEEAVGEMAGALALTVVHPIRAAEDLVRLPRTVALLLATSPEYFARYGALPLEAQLREAARLSTHVVMLVGGSEAAAGRLGALGAEALSLTAEGELVLGRAVAAGAVRAPWGAGAGALSVVHMASGPVGGSLATTSPGPGRWVHKTPTTESEAARDYQEQVTGQPAWRVYAVDGVEFDGFTGGELLEAKGPSYKHFLEKDGTAKPWFTDGDGLRSLVDQARNQWRVAEKSNVPLVWHVAELEFVHFLRKTFQRQGLKSITVRHTPPTR